MCLSQPMGMSNGFSDEVTAEQPLYSVLNSCSKLFDDGSTGGCGRG